MAETRRGSSSSRSNVFSSKYELTPIDVVSNALEVTYTLQIFCEVLLKTSIHLLTYYKRSRDSCPVIVRSLFVRSKILGPSKRMFVSVLLFIRYDPEETILAIPFLVPRLILTTSMTSYSLQLLPFFCFISFSTLFLLTHSCPLPPFSRPLSYPTLPLHPEPMTLLDSCLH